METEATRKTDPAVASDPTANTDSTARAAPAAKSAPIREAGSKARADSRGETRPAGTGAAAASPAAGVQQRSAVTRWLAASAAAVARNPGRTAKIIGALLLAVIVVQNGEPTGIDVLFWSIPPVPKLVLMLICMAIGALTWELIRRSRRRGGDGAATS